MSHLSWERLRRRKTLVATRHVGEAVEFVVADDGAYWIVVPVGPSGVGFLGDSGNEMRRLNWLYWVFIATALCVLLTVALPYLRAIAIGLVTILA